MAVSGLAGCGGNVNQTDITANSGFKEDRNITIVSRENGSGTRGAFIELMGIEEKGSDSTAGMTGAIEGTCDIRGGFTSEALIATGVVLFVFILIINLSCSVIKGRKKD